MYQALFNNIIAMETMDAPIGLACIQNESL